MLDITNDLIFTYFDENLELKECTPNIHKKTGLYIRPNTQDNSMLSDCLNNYKEALELINKDDIVLDLGANIGGFSYLVKDKCKKVYAVEAEPNCIKVLKANCPDINIIEAAVVKNDYAHSTVAFEINKSKNNSCSGHTLIDNKARPSRLQFNVPVIRFNDLIRTTQATVIKIDIEGGEYGILDKEIPGSIKLITGELHGFNKSTNPLMYSTVAKLKEDGWTFIFEEVEKVFSSDCLINFTCVR